MPSVSDEKPVVEEPAAETAVDLDVNADAAAAPRA